MSKLYKLAKQIQRLEAEIEVFKNLINKVENMPKLETNKMCIELEKEHCDVCAICGRNKEEWKTWGLCDE